MAEQVQLPPGHVVKGVWRLLQDEAPRRTILRHGPEDDFGDREVTTNILVAADGSYEKDDEGPATCAEPAAEDPEWHLVRRLLVLAPRPSALARTVVLRPTGQPPAAALCLVGLSRSASDPQTPPAQLAVPLPARALASAVLEAERQRALAAGEEARVRGGVLVLTGEDARPPVEVDPDLVPWLALDALPEGWSVEPVA